jgi:precorrin-6A/cobalt-precorrin-6A reductase
MAGAREAHGIVTGLLARGGRVIASLPERERTFDPLPVPTRVGRFASPEAFETWIAGEQVGTVIDAGHAFDMDISALVNAVCERRQVAYLRVLRPAWQATARDLWIHAASVREASEAVPAEARVFSNTGWHSLPDYAGFGGACLYLRQTHPTTAPAPYSFARFIEGTPPFSEAEEEGLFRELRITHLICRNVGGTASRSKLLAARRFGLPVFMVARPPIPDRWPVVETVADALAWDPAA